MPNWSRNTLTTLATYFMKMKSLLHSQCSTSLQKAITTQLLHIPEPSAITAINGSSCHLKMGDGIAKLVLKTCKPAFIKNAANLGSNCRHIVLAKEEAPGWSAEQSVEEIRLHLSRNVNQKAVSHLSIAPPTWCRITSDDKDLEQVPFHSGGSLPAIFSLDASSRCSCGMTDDKLPVETSQVIVFISNTAIEKLVETRYCSCCRNTKGRIGPDMGKHSVFNWNNRIAFSHELFDSFTSQFTRSETPFYSYHQTIMDNYEYERSPYPLCALRTFVLAYFAYIRLQRIGTRMGCQQCGRNPRYVIADGIGLSFPKHHISTLKPPTEYDKSQGHIVVPASSTTATCFIGGHRLRVKILKALEEKFDTNGKDAVEAILNNENVASLFRGALLTDRNGNLWTRKVCYSLKDYVCIATWISAHLQTFTCVIDNSYYKHFPGIASFKCSLSKHICLWSIMPLEKSLILA